MCVQANIPTYDYSALLYLNSQGDGFMGGDFAFIDDDEAGPSVEAILDPVEQIGEHGGRCRRPDQTLGLEGLEIGRSELFSFGVEQTPEGAAKTEWRERLFEFGRLQQDG